MKFKIEVYRNGEWVHQDSADDIKDAYLLASSLCQQTPEDYIRITGPRPRINVYRTIVLILNLIIGFALLIWLMHQ